MRLASEAPMGLDGDRVEPDRGGVPAQHIRYLPDCLGHAQPAARVEQWLLTPSVSSMRTSAMPLGVTGPVPSSRSASPRIASRPALTAARSITTAEINRPDAARSTNSTTPRRSPATTCRARASSNWLERSASAAVDSHGCPAASCRSSLARVTRTRNRRATEPYAQTDWRR
jgi:hypothetical protein